MKLLLLLTLSALVAGCADTPPVRPTDPTKQVAFDLVNPGGPIYQPRQFGVGEPPPADPPFGKFFSNDRPDNPPITFRDPYWITGYYTWKGNQWEWIAGRWVERPRPGLIWINARYLGNARWQTGYWE